MESKLSGAIVMTSFRDDDRFVLLTSFTSRPVYIRKQARFLPNYVILKNDKIVGNRC